MGRVGWLKPAIESILPFIDIDKAPFTYWAQLVIRVFTYYTVKGAEGRRVQCEIICARTQGVPEQSLGQPGC